MKAEFNIIAIPFLLLAASADAAEPRNPVPASNPGTWIMPIDYPSMALRMEAEGVVRFAVAVAADGSVSDCTVSGSSGHAELDTRVCDLMRSRARFHPATDGKGRPVAGIWASSVRWEIPEGAAVLQEAPIPPEASLHLRYVVEKDGKVTGCEVLEAPPTVSTQAMCDRFGTRTHMPALGNDGQPVRTEITVTMKTEHRRLPD